MSTPEKVLLLEDDIALVRTFSPLLRKFGFEPHIALNGIDALILAGRTHYAFVIADIVMPGTLNGYHAIKAIRKLREQSNQPWMPEIVISGDPSDQTQDCIRDLRPAIFLPKPFGAFELLEAINQLRMQAVSIHPAHRLFQKT